MNVCMYTCLLFDYGCTYVYMSRSYRHILSHTCTHACMHMQSMCRACVRTCIYTKNTPIHTQLHILKNLYMCSLHEYIFESSAHAEHEYTCTCIFKSAQCLFVQM